jgi:SagB-type dehydrogenase family enzyme
MSAENIGSVFQEKTKYVRGSLGTALKGWNTKPAEKIGIPDGAKFSLTKIAAMNGEDVLNVIRRRRSGRNYSEAPMTLEALSAILAACAGVTGENANDELRAAPSVGALYPVETYVVANRIESLPKGVYLYSSREHSLLEIRKGDFSKAIARALLDQQAAAGASAVFVWTAVFSRAAWKYSERGLRYVYLGAGHIAENLVLAATALGLASCPIGAFYDEEVNEIVNVDGKEESAIYACCAGKGASER